MRERAKGLFRQDGTNGAPNVPWVAPPGTDLVNRGQDGEWVTEQEYRAKGYFPEFDSLPVRIVRGMPVPDDLDDQMCEADKRFIDAWIEKNAKRT